MSHSGSSQEQEMLPVELKTTAGDVKDGEAPTEVARTSNSDVPRSDPEKSERNEMSVL